MNYLIESSGVLLANAILIYSEKSKIAAIFDVGGKIPKIMKKITNNNLIVKYLIATHSHFDHIFGFHELKQLFPNAQVMCHEGDRWMWSQQIKFATEFGVDIPDNLLEEPDSYFNNDFIVDFQEFQLKALHTPGHSLGSCCFYKENEILITGDTLFAVGAGRTDLAQGDEQQLRESIQTLNQMFSDECLVLPGHDGSAMFKSSIYNALLYLGLGEEQDWW